MKTLVNFMPVSTSVVLKAASLVFVADTCHKRLRRRRRKERKAVENLPIDAL